MSSNAYRDCEPETAGAGKVRIRLNKSNVLDFTATRKGKAAGSSDVLFCNFRPMKCCVILLLGNVILTALSTHILITELNYPACDCEAEADTTRNADVGADVAYSAAERKVLEETLKWLGSHGKTKQAKTAPIFMGDRMNGTELPFDTNLSSVYWQFVQQISTYALYDGTTTNNYKLVDDLEREMATAPILTMMSEPEAGTELKFWVTQMNGLRTIVKPARLAREEELDPNLFYFSEKERHYGEIAAYHLDRILGYNHIPPCVGRVLSIRNDLMRLADDQILDTVHYSPNGRLCFYGQCDYFCDARHPICGDPDEVEFAFCAIIPNMIWKHRNIISPWRRSYMKQRLADWLLPKFNDSYCQASVLTNDLYKSGRRLLDLVDLYILDFFTGNQDRHSYNIFFNVGESGLISYDNGRGFGRSYRDDLTILAPLYHCCRLRKSTYDKLKFLVQNKHNVTLSTLMRYSLARDPLHVRAPVLADKHLQALDRRLLMVFDVINRDCMQKRNLTIDQILVDDGF